MLETAVYYIRNKKVGDRGKSPEELKKDKEMKEALED